VGTRGRGRVGLGLVEEGGWGAVRRWGVGKGRGESEGGKQGNKREEGGAVGMRRGAGGERELGGGGGL